MLREQLKSKIHRARVTDGSVEYEGSISIPEDLCRQVDLWPGEKVLITSITNGARLETYVQYGPSEEKRIIMNGAAARRVHVGDRISIISFAFSEKAVSAKKMLCNEANEVISFEES